MYSCLRLYVPTFITLYTLGISPSLSLPPSHCPAPLPPPPSHTNTRETPAGHAISRGKKVLLKAGDKIQVHASLLVCEALALSY